MVLVSVNYCSKITAAEKECVTDVTPVISLGVNILKPGLWVKERILRQKLKSLRLVNTKQLGVITGDITGEI